MRIHVLQHVPFEDIGSMAEWFRQRGAQLSYTRFYEADAQLPELVGIDLIIAMGGPMSVNDESTLPWLVTEKAFLREAIANEVAVLGVCLGAQLIASALGAQVQPNAEVEVGWFPVWRADMVGEECFTFPPRIELLHWHGETFALPADANLLASSEACRHQAFQIGRRVIGLQCHPEMTPAIVSDLLAEFGADLQPGRWVQSATELAAVPAERYRVAQGLMSDVLTYLLAK